MQLSCKDIGIGKLNKRLISYVRIIYIFYILVYLCLRVIYGIYFKILIRIKRKLLSTGVYNILKILEYFNIEKGKS